MQPIRICGTLTLLWSSIPGEFCVTQIAFVIQVQLAILNIEISWINLKGVAFRSSRCTKATVLRHIAFRISIKPVLILYIDEIVSSSGIGESNFRVFWRWLSNKIGNRIVALNGNASNREVMSCLIDLDDVCLRILMYV
jgi:hypothetical protein